MSASRGVCIKGGSASGGFCMWGVLHPGGGSVSGGSASGGLGRPPRYHGIRSTSGRYASYWNAFLFLMSLADHYWKSVTL